MECKFEYGVRTIISIQCTFKLKYYNLQTSSIRKRVHFKSKALTGGMFSLALTKISYTFNTNLAFQVPLYISMELT